ncbi:hypothetical protein PR048_004259 [Dryococelus australis]|uniref:Uncharacterized protein n=1 Tax=Dryococelus australis TaxID=614101 RepID=A0ABQ9I4Z1_9NEOP|nr:hypothetical protein PR048_004259 [Dryococelus australis]
MFKTGSLNSCVNYVCLSPFRGRGGLAASLLTSHQGEPVAIMPDDAAGLRVFSVISRFLPPFHSGAAPCSPHFTPIGSQDLDVKGAAYSRLKCVAVCLKSATCIEPCHILPTDKMIGSPLKVAIGARSTTRTLHASSAPSAYKRRGMRRACQSSPYRSRASLPLTRYKPRKSYIHTHTRAFTPHGDEGGGRRCDVCRLPRYAASRSVPKRPRPADETRRNAVARVRRVHGAVFVFGGAGKVLEKGDEGRGGRGSNRPVSHHEDSIFISSTRRPAAAHEGRLCSLPRTRADETQPDPSCFRKWRVRIFRAPAPASSDFAVNETVQRAIQPSLLPTQSKKYSGPYLQFSCYPASAAQHRGMRGRGGVMVRLPASRQGEPGSIPGRDHPRILARGDRAGRCRWQTGFVGDLPLPPALAFRSRSILTSLHPHRLSHSLTRRAGGLRLATRYDARRPVVILSAWPIMCWTTLSTPTTVRYLGNVVRKRTSDQRLAELEAYIGMSKMKGQMITVPIGFGRVNLDEIAKEDWCRRGKERPRENTHIKIQEITPPRKFSSPGSKQYLPQRKLNSTVLFTLEPASFLRWLLYSCEATPFLTELHRPSTAARYGFERVALELIVADDTACTASSNLTRQRNGVTGRQRGGTPFTNQRPVTHSLASCGSPANRKPLAACSSQSDAITFSQNVVEPIGEWVRPRQRKLHAISPRCTYLCSVA